MSTPIRIEAENMTLTNYRREGAGSYASGRAFISLVGGATTEMGTASYIFTDITAGIYDVVIGYYDETDGVSRLTVDKSNARLADLSLNQSLGSSGAAAQTLVRQTIATGVTFNSGEVLTITGIEDRGEPARVDYIEFIPVPPSPINGTDAGETLIGDAQDNIINGFAGNDTLIGQAGSDILDGGAGIDRVSYVDAARGVIVNLAQAFAFTSAYNAPLKIMPLGDSITAGTAGTNDQDSGGYRTGLWNRFVTDGLQVDFVGTQSRGPASLGDKDHEGHGGWRIDTSSDNSISKSVNGWLSSAQPDVILLMAGTNDTSSDSVSTMINELSALIDKITTQSPNAQLLVASIPPIHPDEQPATRVQRAVDFNNAMPGLINSKVAQGKRVNFVDMRSLTVNDLTSSTSPDLDNGLHPNAQGYSKIANFWHDAVLNTAGDKDTLLNIENVVGSAFDDKLTGTSGTNIFEGGSGQDTLTGGRGADTFVYRAPSEGLDTITDFGGNDIFRISATGFGSGLRPGTALSTADSATGVLVSSANPTPIGTSANFLYNTSTGLLNFDGDGTGAGAALAIATLSGLPPLSVNQFTIIA